MDPILDSSHRFCHDPFLSRPARQHRDRGPPAADRRAGMRASVPATAKRRRSRARWPVPPRPARSPDASWDRSDARRPMQRAFANTCMIRNLDFNDTFLPGGHPSDCAGALVCGRAGDRRFGRAADHRDGGRLRDLHPPAAEREAARARLGPGLRHRRGNGRRPRQPDGTRARRPRGTRSRSPPSRTCRCATRAPVSSRCGRASRRRTRCATRSSACSWRRAACPGPRRRSPAATGWPS